VFVSARFLEGHNTGFKAVLTLIKVFASFINSCAESNDANPSSGDICPKVTASLIVFENIVTPPIILSDANHVMVPLTPTANPIVPLFAFRVSPILFPIVFCGFAPLVRKSATSLTLLFPSCFVNALVCSFVNPNSFLNAGVSTSMKFLIKLCPGFIACAAFFAGLAKPVVAIAPFAPATFADLAATFADLAKPVAAIAPFIPVIPPGNGNTAKKSS